MSRLLNFVMFYVGWFACVGGAARGQLWLGPIVAVAILTVHLSLTSNRGQEAKLILLAVFLASFVTPCRRRLASTPSPTPAPRRGSARRGWWRSGCSSRAR